MSVTVKYVDGTARVFASEQDALLQAAHDISHPNSVNPDFIVDGDQSQTHTNWIGIEFPENVKLLHDPQEVINLKCECVDCEFGRLTTGFGIDQGGEKRRIYEQIYRDRVINVRAG